MGRADRGPILHGLFKAIAHEGPMKRQSIPKRLVLALLAAPLFIGAAGGPMGEVRVEIADLRNAKGTLLLCLSASAEHFPDCGADPAAQKLRVPAGRATGLVFTGVAPGDYALSVMHDENGNGKLDTAMRIPREGFGFSRNPVVRFGPPVFRDVRFAVPSGASHLPIKMRYFL